MEIQKMNEKYTKLFTPVRLTNGVEVRNKIVMAPMTTFAGNSDGTVSEDELKYYERRAKGLGMLVTACIGVSPSGIAFPGQFTAYASNAKVNLERLSKIIKKDRTKAILQIHHGGRMAVPELVGGEVVSASNIPSPRTPDIIPRELSDAEIEGIIEDFGKATKLAIETGFDGVEIHGANTYLIQQFFSQHSNRRTDKWGGDIEKRMLFPNRVIEKVKEIVREYGSKEFIVGYRLSPEEIETPGIRIDDTLILVENLIKHNLDYIHISLNDVWTKPSMNPEYDKPMLEMITEKVAGRIPVVGVGSIHKADDAVSAIDTKADFIAIGRELIMDPDWIEKVQTGNEHSIITTIKSNPNNELVIPEKLFNMMKHIEGWFPFKD